jgi:hypothetical protein
MPEASPKALPEAPVMLIAEVLYESPLNITAGAVAEHLKSRLPKSKVVSEQHAKDTFLIAHEDHVQTFKDGKQVPALTAVSSYEVKDPARFTPAIGQTWDWPQASAAVGRAKHQITVNEMMSRLLDAQTRIDLFYEVVRAIVELTPPQAASRPLAVFAQHAERIVDPARLVRASGSPELTERLAAFLNVRLFRITNGQPGDTLMDTRGLAALGLPDLQLHFRDLDPSRVAAMLYNTAHYLLLHGDRIEDGHTVQGLTADQRWRCQHEEALVGPKRVVIDVDPGEPWAAGDRKR